MHTYKLHFIRHGETGHNRQKLCVGGGTDCPLSPEGATELRLLQETYAYPAVQKVYQSPMLRCRQTAEILYPDVLSRPVDALRECHFGEFEGRPLDELKEEDIFLRWVEGRVAPPGGESAAELGERIVAGFEIVLADMMQHKLYSAAVVTHGVVMMGLLAAYGYPRYPMTHWAVDNGCGYTVSTSAAMWMRDRCFEVIEALPLRAH